MKLTTPAQNAHLDPRLETNAKALRAWLDGLPLLNPEKTAREAGGYLHALNRQPLTPAERMELLAPLAEIYWRILDPVTAKPDINGITTPEHTALLDVLARFCQNLAFGYKIVLSQSLNKTPIFSRNKQRQPAALLAMQFLGQTLCHRYANYKRMPDSLWAEIDQIYRYARTQNFHGTRLPGYRGEKTSIDQCFIEISLLKHSDPFRLAGGTLWEAQRILRQQAKLVELTPWADKPEQPGLICLTTANPERQGFRHALCLDIRQLIDKVQTAITSQRPGEFDFNPQLRASDALHVLERLLNGWNDDIPRKSERLDLPSAVELGIGMERAFYFLNRCMGFDRYAYLSPDEQEEIDVSGQGMEWNPARQVDYKPTPCRSINRGAGGIALRSSQSPVNTPRVGQIVSVRNQAQGSDQPGVWFVGTVRWLTVEDNGQFEAGIQYLARDATAVAVRCSDRSLGNREYSASLRADVQKTDKLWHVMITPTGLYARDRYLDVVQGGKHTRIKCQKLLETGWGFERFTYEKV